MEFVMKIEVEKGWGKEVIFADTEKYAGKFLHFSYSGSKMSMHFHKEKDETWIVVAGSFLLRTIDTRNAHINESILCKGDTWRNPPLLPHQLVALQDNSIVFEVSTTDDPQDNYRVFQGDSQK
jgi:mannose-6-phosphate isomerase-like protein (cupin superfamily)